MSALLAQLERGGLLSSLDVELALCLARLGGERDEAVLLAAALASQAVADGHVCLDLARRACTPWVDDAGQSHAPWPELTTWLARLRHSPLVSTDGASMRPLVLEHGHKLYLARYRDHEQRVAERLLDLVARPLPISELPPDSAALLEQLFPPRADGTPDLQRAALVASRARRLSVIVGGPGTGKTSTVVKLLALLAEDALSSHAEPPRVLMLAPTGKAAQRLAEATLRARDRLQLAERVRAAIPGEAVTVHRALGSIGGSSTHFRHGPDHPLDCDLVLLDEASMVDLGLMRRLLDALPEHARLVMLGDPDQLASVEAGGVLGDVCAAAEVAGSPLAGAVSRLVESHRYGAHSGIAQLALAVHAGDADAALAVLERRHDDVSFHGPLPAPRLGRALESEVRAHYQGLRSGELETRLETLDRYRVLSALRKGELGVEALNLAIARVVRGLSTRPHESYAGRPVLVTQNDYGSGLFNGDVGVLHQDGRRAPLSAWFREGSGKLRSVALGRLPAHESVYAMTVHKSQGSEFERVAIVLPDRPSYGSRTDGRAPTGLLTRELLYTAITRARRAVSLYASEAALRTAIGERVVRSSGLVERLVG
jgi:exodeoxyribonuclease V alpha subunit